jgi:tetratricopeptide (TPR) repeat protein
MENDDYKNAVVFYERALKVNPKYGIVFENRGISYYNLGYYRMAAADFEAAMKYNPQLTTKLRPLYQDAKSR